MHKVYFVDGVRSYIGLKGGMYKTIPAERLGAETLRVLLERNVCAEPDLILGGNAVGGGGNITRLAALLANVRQSIPCFTLDSQCASAASALQIALGQLRCGMTECVAAGGFESASMQPLRVYNEADARYRREGYMVAQFSPETFSADVMLEAAERTAQLCNVTRDELDRAAVRSHKLAREAREQGALKNFTISICGATRDEAIRNRMSERLTRRMPTLFKYERVRELVRPYLDKIKRGELATIKQICAAHTSAEEGEFVPTLTAANSCLINDGAAWALLCTDDFVRAHKLKPRLEILDALSVGVAPGLSPLGADATLTRLLQQNGIEDAELDAVEMNEAFAVISVLALRFHPCFERKYCRYGGALAYGHPYGASGAVLLLHLCAALEETRGNLGALAIAGAGGLGTAVLTRRVAQEEF